MAGGPSMAGLHRERKWDYSDSKRRSRLGLLGLEPSQPVKRFCGLALQQQPRYHFAQRGAVLEAMPRSAADNPCVRMGGMLVHDEVVVRRVLVLTYAGFDQGRVFHSRETISEILSRLDQTVI